MKLNAIRFTRLRIIVILLYTTTFLAFQSLLNKLNYKIHMNIINAQFAQVGRHWHSTSPLIVQPIRMVNTSISERTHSKRKVHFTESD